MYDQDGVSRRGFLKTVSGGFLAAGSLPLLIPAGAIGREGKTAANDRIHIGCIGVGPQGTHDMRQILKHDVARVIALSDVKSNVLEEKRRLVNEFYGDEDCVGYHDFRELVAREDIDGCLVATTDHWHVLASLAAVRAGKDVYMEKPMGLTLEQDQAMRQAVHEHQRIFQFGTQQRSDPEFRQACELVRNGKIGELKTINVWSPGSSSGGPTERAPVPPWLDYEMWLGPAPYTPYTTDRCENAWWWFISDYALGFIAGWGIHPIDIALWGAEDKFAGPWEVEGKGWFPSEGVCDTAMNWDVKIRLGSGVVIDFRGDPYPDEWKQRYEDDSSHGTAFEGSEGWISVRRGKINAHPKSILETKLGPNDTPLYYSEHHAGNFLDCIRSRKETVCPVDAAVRGDTLCHISDIAIRLQRKLVFDPETETFVGDEDANRKLSRPMRAPWHL
ncbi:MAG: gfo/Idh/MocA family oxidoreductase [Candidatus Omnitrophota bacterium]|jgi:predicted dehydrogenase|nr:MAG: gfo/Idh/MocA family oxidoreductase [Candidatus Omnitrophota bacterium]